MDTLTIAGRTFQSRLFVGTGKYRSFQEMARCHAASGAEVVTVAVRRVNLSDRSKESLLDYIDASKFFILPNTAGCYTADDAVRTARLGREAGLSNWVKLEVIGDERTLFPDNEALVEATRVLVREGKHTCRLDQRLVVGEERALVADHLELHPVRQARLAPQPRRPHRIVRGVAAGGIREDEELR